MTASPGSGPGFDPVAALDQEAAGVEGATPRPPGDDTDRPPGSLPARRPRRARLVRPPTPDTTELVAPPASLAPPASAPDAYEALRQEVLGEIQRRGTGAADEAAVGAMVRELVDAYRARARAGLGGRPLGAPEAVVARLRRSVLGYGPLTPYLAGEVRSEEVQVVGCELSHIDGDGRVVVSDEHVTEAEMRSHFDRLLGTVGASVDESHPMVQVQVLGGRARVGVVVPPVAAELNASIRFYAEHHETLAKLVTWDAVSVPAASLLAATTYTPTGVLITGMPGAGKTTAATATLRAAPETLRVVCCEDTPEINPEHLRPFRWRTVRPGPDGTGGASLRDLVRMALGMRPDLLCVGEIRGEEAYELTRAGNAGCGMLATLHANSARQGLQALVSTATMAGANVSPDVVRAVFASVVDLVVHLDREPLQAKRAGGGRVRRQVMEVVAVPPLQGAGADFTVEPIFVREELGAPLRWTGAPLPDDLRVRLDRALRPLGKSTQGILEGRDALV